MILDAQTRVGPATILSSVCVGRQHTQFTRGQLINLTGTIRPFRSSRELCYYRKHRSRVLLPVSNPDLFNYRNHAINYSNYRAKSLRAAAAFPK